MGRPSWMALRNPLQAVADTVKRGLSVSLKSRTPAPLRRSATSTQLPPWSLLWLEVNQAALVQLSPHHLSVAHSAA